MSWNLFGVLGKATGANFGTAVATKGGTSEGGSTTTVLAPGKQDVTITNPLIGQPPTGQTVGDPTDAPPIPDAILAASNAAAQASQAAQRERNRAMGGDSLLLGPSGSATPAASTNSRSLLGY